MTVRFVTLGDVGKISAGNPAPQDAADFSNDGEPFVRMQDVGREHRTRALSKTVDKVSADAIARHRLRRFPAGTLLIPKSGASINLNHRALLARDAFVVSHLATVIPDTSQVDPEYLYFWSLSYDPRRQAQTTSLPSLPTALIKAAQLPLPSLPEQGRIVNFLTRAEAIVRLRREAQAKAAELIPALFLDMFGDPANNPKGWPAVRLGDLAEKMSDGPFGSNLKTSHYVESGVRVIRLQNIGVGELIDKDRAFVSEEHYASLPRHHCKPDDVIIGTLGDPNLRAFVVPQWLKESLNKADCVQFRCNAEMCNPAYISWLMNMPATLSMASSMVQGITRSRISMGRLRELAVPIPPLELQEQFAVKVEAVRSITSRQITALANAQAAFDALLYRSFAAD